MREISSLISRPSILKKILLQIKASVKYIYISNYIDLTLNNMINGIARDPWVYIIASKRLFD